MRVHAMPHYDHRARDELDRSTLDLDSRQKRQIHVSVTGLLNSTVQHSTDRYGTYCMHECMRAIYSAS